MTASVFWFRPPIRCEELFDAWLLMWGWIGTAYSQRWYVHLVRL